jgi:hypothetical protein
MPLQMRHSRHRKDLLEFCKQCFDPVKMGKIGTF